MSSYGGSSLFLDQFLLLIDGAVLYHSRMTSISTTASKVRPFKFLFVLIFLPDTPHNLLHSFFSSFFLFRFVLCVSQSQCLIKSIQQNRNVNLPIRSRPRFCPVAGKKPIRPLHRFRPVAGGQRANEHFRALSL